MRSIPWIMYSRMPSPPSSTKFCQYLSDHSMFDIVGGLNLTSGILLGLLPPQYDDDVERISPISPSSIRLCISIWCVLYLQTSPVRTDRLFDFAFLAVSTMLLSPGMSRANGFSTNACLPAAMAAAKCLGLNRGDEVSRTMSTPLSITF